MAQYDKIPDAVKTKPSNYKVSIPAVKLYEFRELLGLSPIGPATYENQQEDRRYGVTRKWMLDAKEHWTKKFNWKTHEDHINSYPNFIMPITDDDGHKYDIHFVAFFSERTDAVPVLLLHGWPGSFLEFLPILSILRARYPPKELPYHVIVPSLPGWAFSSRPPLDKDWAIADIARVVNKLMVELGFESGYVAQGGDIGSMVARQLAVKYDSCKALHVNFNIMQQPEGVSEDAVNEAEKKGLQRAYAFATRGIAYAMEHGTRPATIGLTLSASPIAMLAWIGEKFLAWTDEDPPLEKILESVTLYWLTDTYPTSIYTYRQYYEQEEGRRQSHSNPAMYCKKPFGYSWFPMELAPIPKAWVATTGDLVWHRQHSSGGHFAAMEKPQELLQDIEDFIGQIWATK